MLKTAKLLALALAVPGLLVLGSASSSAVPCQNTAGTYPEDCPRFGQPGNYLANNKTHRVDFYDTLTGSGAAAQWVLNNQFPRFGFGWTYVTSTDYDVRIIDDYYPTQAWFGRTTCPSGPSGTYPRKWCYGQKLQLNLSNVGGWDTDFGRRALLCHELGHTVGLNHPENGYVSSTCLENETNPDGSASNIYDSTDVTKVSGGY